MDSLIIYGIKNRFLQNREPTCEGIQSNSHPTASLVRSNIGVQKFSPLNPELNPIYYLLALLGAYHFLHVINL